MRLALISGAAAGTWLFVLVFITSLARMAARGDRHLIAGAAGAEEHDLGQLPRGGSAAERIWGQVAEFNLDAHPRPTRARPPAQRARGLRALELVAPSAHRGVTALPALGSTSPQPGRRRGGAGWRLNADEAATALGVSPEALELWERRYGYPVSLGPLAGDERTYRYAEVLALQEALQACVSVPAAIKGARAQLRDRRPPRSCAD